MDGSGGVVDATVVPHLETCLASNLTWTNSIMHFDHVAASYLSLFEVAIFKGWTVIMADATDSRDEVSESWTQPVLDTVVYQVLGY